MPETRCVPLLTGIARNFSWLAAGTIAHLGAITVASLILARLLDPSHLGMWGYAFSVVGMAYFLYDGGLAQLVLTEVTKRSEQLSQVCSQFLYFRVYTGILALGVLALVFSQFARSYQEYWTVLLIALYSVVAAAVSAVSAVFRALQRMEYETWAKLAMSAVLLVSFVLIFHFHERLPGTLTVHAAGVSFCIAAFLGFATAYRLLLSRAGFRRTAFSARDQRGCLRLAYPLAVSTFFGTLYTHVDTVMLSWITSHEQVAKYYVVQRIVFLVSTLMLVLIASVNPQLASLHRQGDLVSLVNLLRRLVLAITLTCAVIAGFFLLVGPTVISVLFGDYYGQVNRALIIFLAGELFMSLARTSMAYLLLADNQGKFIRASMVVLLLNIALNMVLIPSYGYVGAAAASACCHTIFALILFVETKNSLAAERSQLSLNELGAS